MGPTSPDPASGLELGSKGQRGPVPSSAAAQVETAKTSRFIAQLPAFVIDKQARRRRGGIATCSRAHAHASLADLQRG